MASINKLSDIVDNGLCIGCGLCQSITGKDKIEISMTDKGRLEPKEINKISSDNFNKILNVCPGVIIEGLPKNLVDSEILIGGLKSEDYKISAVNYYLDNARAHNNNLVKPN